MKQCKVSVFYDEKDFSRLGSVEFEMPEPVTLEALAIVRGSLLTLTNHLNVKIKRARARRQ